MVTWAKLSIIFGDDDIPKLIVTCRHRTQSPRTYLCHFDISEEKRKKISLQAGLLPSTNAGDIQQKRWSCRDQNTTISGFSQSGKAGVPKRCQLKTDDGNVIDTWAAPLLCHVAPCHVTPCHMTRPCPSASAHANKMAAFLQWRKFVFFEKETVKEHGDTGKNVVLPTGISACDSGRGHIVLGDIL